MKMISFPYAMMFISMAQYKQRGRWNQDIKIGLKIKRREKNQF